MTSDTPNNTPTRPGVNSPARPGAIPPTRPDLPPLRDVIKKYGLDARRKLGQNFLLDLNLCDKIARAPGDLSGCTVIEVGPGPGGLTRCLLDNGAKKVIAIEKDPRCIEALGELTDAYGPRLEIMDADALKVELHTLGDAPRRIVANLPYNIATPLMIRWLRNVDAFAGFTLMFQKEVADRLVAEPRSKEYGRLSVITQWLCDVRREFNVGREAFTPAPKVESTIVGLTPRPQPLAPATFEVLEQVTAAAFGQRRKMIRASLKSLKLDFEALGLNPTSRAEELSVEDFCAIAQAVSGDK